MFLSQDPRNRSLLHHKRITRIDFLVGHQDLMDVLWMSVFAGELVANNLEDMLEA